MPTRTLQQEIDLSTFKKSLRLSQQDAKFKAQAIQQRMELEIDLSDFEKSLEELFQIAPPMKLTSTDKKELDQLSGAIRNATADNTARTRVLELLDKALGG